MRILIDECAPRALKKLVIDNGHACQTVQEAGWSGKQNGELLSLAETTFDVLITVDTNISYQQNLTGRKIAIIVLRSFSNRLEHLRQHFSDVLMALDEIKPGEIVLIGNKN